MWPYLEIESLQTWIFLVGLAIKNPPANTGNPTYVCSIPGLVRSSGGGNGNLLQYSCLENSMDRRAWRATVYGVIKRQTWLSNWVQHFHGSWPKCHIEKSTITNIPWALTGFPGGSISKKSAFSAGDPGSTTGSGRSPGERNGYPLQYSCLENSMERGAWWALLDCIFLEGKNYYLLHLWISNNI